MKAKYFLSSLLIGLGLLAFTSCEDDNDSNPTLKHPETFQLNKPALADNVVVLNPEETSSPLRLTWKQPDFGYPAFAVYHIQMSCNGSFDEVESEEEAPNYIEFDETSVKAYADLDNAMLNRNIMKLLDISSAEEVPESLTIYFRVIAKLQSGVSVTSNTIQVQAAPYFAALVAADPELWYLVGGCIADGSWGNNADGVGVSLIPMSLIEGETYNEVTGKGRLEYTSYFNEGGIFKFVKTPGDWGEQLGWDADAGIVKINDGGSGNFTIPSTGYYHIVLNTNDYSVTIDPVDAPREFSQMGIAGSFNEWSFQEIERVETTTDVCHTWRAVVDWTGQTDEWVQFKFLTDSSWATNWGTWSENWGFGTQGGDNIPAKPGKYLIIFNDVTGFYRVIPQE